ncbi:MAG: thiamine pyrophosphate-binding protein [Alphaproteobacteria bacterium]
MSDSAPANTIFGRNAFIASLLSEGVTRMFGNPGTTELPIMHALSDYPEMGYVLAMQESVVIGIADGFSRASGELVACNVHVAPGLGNAMGAIYTARIAGTPMIVTAGQQEQGHGLTEPLLYDPLVPIAQSQMKWATEVARIEDLPRVLHRAAKVAMTPPTGPVFISLPGDILNEQAAVDLGKATRVDARVRPSDDSLNALADAILSAKNPVLIAGHEIVASDAFDEAAALAEALGLPVYQQTIIDGAHFPSEHPAYMGVLTRHQPVVREKLMPFDMMICVGSDALKMSVYNTVDPMPETMRLIQIGQRDWELGKNYAAEIAVRADVKETLKVLTPLLQAKGGDTLAQGAAKRIEAFKSKNWATAKAAKVATTAALRSEEKIVADWAMMRLVEMLPDQAIVVDEGITTAGSLVDFLPYRDRYSYFGNTSGGIGWGIAAAVGVQEAHPDRQVVAIIGDGSSMYAIQALWSAANLKQQTVFVICNNQGYSVLKQRLKAFHGNDKPIGMDFNDPPLDCVALAKGFGVAGERAESATAFEAAFQRGLDHDGPYLVEAMIA